MKVVGNHVWIKVNGQAVIEDFELHYEPKPEGGPIAIQKHTNRHGWGGPMAFRNIFVKE